MKPFPEETNGNPSAACASLLLEVVPAVMRAIRGQMRSRSATELSVVQFRALAFLDRRPGASVSGVAEHIGMTLPSASKLVQVLLERGYLQRQVDGHDRRRSVVTPTAKGRRILDAARQATREYLAEQIAHLDKREKAAIALAMRSLGPIFLADMTEPSNIPRTRCVRANDRIRETSS